MTACRSSHIVLSTDCFYSWYELIINGLLKSWFVEYALLNPKEHVSHRCCSYTTFGIKKNDTYTYTAIIWQVKNMHIISYLASSTLYSSPIHRSKIY